MYSRMKITTFNDRFDTLCSESSLNDIQIAQRLGVSKQTISAWRSGQRSPKPPTITTISAYFHVSIRWLMGFDVPRYEEDATAKEESTSIEIKHPEVRILAKGFDAMPEAERKRALEIARMIFEKYAYLFDEKKESDDDAT